MTKSTGKTSRTSKAMYPDDGGLKEQVRPFDSSYMWDVVLKHFGFKS